MCLLEKLVDLLIPLDPPPLNCPSPLSAPTPGYCKEHMAKYVPRQEGLEIGSRGYHGYPRVLRARKDVLWNMPHISGSCAKFDTRFDTT
jgi:hypothetical protein